MTRISLPPQQQDVVDGTALTGPWRRFVEGVWRKLGGPINVDMTASSISVGGLSVVATSNTNVRISFVGSDGTTRKVDLTVS